MLSSEAAELPSCLRQPTLLEVILDWATWASHRPSSGRLTQFLFELFQEQEIFSKHFLHFPLSTYHSKLYFVDSEVWLAETTIVRSSQSPLVLEKYVDISQSN